jgi:23S rRNA (adenine2503-C2)-methyltransferase
MINKIKTALQGEPNYRFKQAFDAVFKLMIDDWQKATTLPATLKEKLQQAYPLKISGQIFWSKNKASAKAVISLADGLTVETVLMRHQDSRNTVCLSSQVGCPLGCKFCLTGQQGFKRNLTVEEIIIQALFFARILKKGNERISNLVFMGMGEPLLNYQNVMEAIKIFNNPDFFNIGARHISISTVGVVGGIKKLAQEKLQLNLAISLHAPTNELRSQLIPANEKYPLETIIKDLDYYLAKTGRRVMIEYLMMEDINDSPQHAQKLSELLKTLTSHLYFINLIRYNQTDVFKPSKNIAVNNFKKVLEKNRIEVTERYRLGADISAACGQLAGK